MNKRQQASFLVLVLAGLGACDVPDPIELSVHALDDVDPGAGGFAALTVAGTNDVRVMAKARNGEWLGNWFYASSNQILPGSGPMPSFGFNDCFAITSGWGLGVIGVKDGTERFEAAWLAPWGTKIGEWTIRSTQEISVRPAPGRRFEFIMRDAEDGIAFIGFDTQHRPVLLNHLRPFSVISFPGSDHGIIVDPSDRIIAAGLFPVPAWLLRSNSRLALIKEDFRDPGKFVAHAEYSWGTQFGSWVLRSTDLIHGFLDLESESSGSNHEILISGDDGIVALRGDLRGTPNNTLLVAAHIRRGQTMVGGWTVSGSDVIGHTGSMRAGDGLGGFAIKNDGFGRALATVRQGRFEAMAIAGWGGAFGNWVLSPWDRSTGFVDLNETERAQLVMQSGWGIGAFQYVPSTNTVDNVFMAPAGTTFPGGWTYQASDLVLNTGNYRAVTLPQFFDNRVDFLVKHP